MTALKWENFGGMMPRVSARLLPENASQVCQDTKLWQRELRPFGGTTRIASIYNGVNTRTIYPYWQSGIRYWFNWATDVDVARPPISNDAFNRRYYTGDGAPKKTGSNIATGLEGTLLPADWLWMGVQNPTKACDAAQTVAGSGQDQLRAYIVTHVTTQGEESGPSLPDEIECKEGATIRITRFLTVVASACTAAADTVDFAAAHNLPNFALVWFTANAPAGTSLNTDYWITVTDSTHFKISTSFANALAGIYVDITGSNTPTVQQRGLDQRYDVASWRIYRTNAGNRGAEYQFVAEVSTLVTQTYDDAIASDALGKSIKTIDFAEPPTTLIGLRSLPGGFLGGIDPVARQFCMSEQFYPYAWPVKYRFALDYVPVSVMAVGSGALVSTVGRPYLFQGQSPGAMGREMLLADQGCVAKSGSVESPTDGVYPTPDGLFRASLGVKEIVTEPYFSKKEWQALNPSTFRAVVYDQRYFATYGLDSAATQRKVLVFSPTNKVEAVSTLNINATALYSDIESDGLFMVVDGEVVQWDADTQNPREYDWKSKKVPVPRPINMAVLQLKGDFSLGAIIGGNSSFAEYAVLRAAIEAINAALAAGVDTYSAGAFGGTAFGATDFSGSGFLDPLPDIGTGVTVLLYYNGVLKATVLVSSEDINSLPNTANGDEFEIEIKGKIPIEQAVIATSVEELNQVQ